MVVKEFCILVCICVSVWAQLRTPPLSRTGSAPHISLSGAISEQARVLPRLGSLTSRGSSLSSSSTSLSSNAAVNTQMFTMEGRYSPRLERIQPRLNGNVQASQSEAGSLPHSSRIQENAQGVRAREGAPPLSLRQVLLYFILKLRQVLLFE